MTSRLLTYALALCAAALGCAGCSDDLINDRPCGPGDGSICFAPTLANVSAHGNDTRGTALNRQNPIGNFAVRCVLDNDAETLYYTESQVHPGGGGLWYNNTVRYWPEDQRLRFYAWNSDAILSLNEQPEAAAESDSPSPASDLNASSQRITFSHSPAPTAADQQDIVMAYSCCSYGETDGGAVPLNFEHALSALFVDAALGTGYQITHLSLTGVYGQGRCIFDPTNDKGDSHFAWTYTTTTPDAVYTQDCNAESAVTMTWTDNEGETKQMHGAGSPFIILPQRNMDQANLEVTYTTPDGQGKTMNADLSKLNWELKAGHAYQLTLHSPSDYPPVENLLYVRGQDSQGNLAISLTWDFTKPEASTVHRVKVIVTDMLHNDSPDAPGAGTKEYVIENDQIRNHETQNWTWTLPAATSEAQKAARNEWDNFHYTVKVVYTDDNPDKTDEYYYSIERSIRFSTHIGTDVPCGFFLPQNYDTSDPVSQLLDDDDKAAAWWFQQNCSQSHFVNRTSLPDLDPKAVPVLWVPSGIMNKIKVYETDRVTGEHDKWVETGPAYCDTRFTQKWGYYNPDNQEFRVNGERSGDYFTEDDIAAVREYYYHGGNLLLTGFSVALLYEFGVMRDGEPEKGELNDIKQLRPYYVIWNEVQKNRKMWFINASFGGKDWNTHPLYRNMVKLNPSDYKDQEFEVVGFDNLPMYPLLSPDADDCENNNICWDFNENRQNGPLTDMEKHAKMEFIGTWGQIADASVGVAGEWKAGSNCYGSHGACVVIGLGAYEFNNGLEAFDPNKKSKNKYQSNIERMTANALEYLQ